MAEVWFGLFLTFLYPYMEKQKFGIFVVVSCFHFFLIYESIKGKCLQEPLLGEQQIDVLHTMAPNSFRSEMRPCHHGTKRQLPIGER